MSLNTGWLLFEDYNQRGQAGSSRIRGRWVMKYWKGAERYIPGKNYDVEIYQKYYWDRHMAKSPAIKIIDICDPDWVDSQSRFHYALKYADAITFPTEEFARHFAKITDKPTMVIPDRIDLATITRRKEHKGQATSAVWFGYSQNQGAIPQVIATLRRLKIKLTIISDNMAVYARTEEDAKLFNFIPYNEQTIHDDIINNGDILLLPKPVEMSYAKRFKSPNKEDLGWALGMPVAKTAEELEWFIDPVKRQQACDEKWDWVKRNLDVKLSVVDYLTLIERITK